MELLPLIYFCDAAKTQNFSHTAQKFGVPPSNISQCIRRLEDELGTKLFTRYHNRISLNAEGELFFKKIRPALELIEEAKSVIAMPKKEKLTVCALTNRQLIMQAAEAFRLLYPDTPVIISHNYDKSTTYDIIICDEHFPSMGKRSLILTEKIALAINKSNPLSQKDSICVSDISQENFISLNAESSLARAADRICKKSGFEPHIVIQSPDPFYVRKCVELNLGIAFVPTISWGGLFSDNVVIRSFGNYSRRTYAQTDTSRRKSSVHRLLEIIDNFNNPEHKA